MTRVLIRKLLRDVRWGLLVVCLLLMLFQLLWAAISERIAGDLLAAFGRHGLDGEMIQEIISEGLGKIIQTLMGGEGIKIDQAQHMMSIAYVHPLIQTILCVWAIGRAAGAIAGEIDKGTMELLLAQPLRRSQLIVAHFVVDCLTIPVICLSMWLGTWIGVSLLGMLDHPTLKLRVDPWQFAPCLVSVALLIFALSGATMWLSSMGRWRWRVLSLTVLLALSMFLINVIGQLWDPAKPFRPFTIFHYYQPQPMILPKNWAQNTQVWMRLGVLAAVGSCGYGLALWTFCKRDLPAPL